MNIERLRGTGVALVTPFNQNGKVDYLALEKIIEHVINGGINYIVLLGSTGESQLLWRAEKIDIINFAKEKIAGRVPIVVCLGGSHTEQVVDDLNILSSMDLVGIDALLATVPSYVLPSQEGMKKHFKMIADASPVPVILYNVPSRTGANLEPETTFELANYVNKNGVKSIIGIKEANTNGEQILKYFPLFEEFKNRKEFLLISGEDSLNSGFLKVMDGTISVIANSFPCEFSDYVSHIMNRNFDESDVSYKKISRIIKAISEEGNPAGIKALLNAMGLCENILRLPLTPISMENHEKIKEALISYKVTA